MQDFFKQLAERLRENLEKNEEFSLSFSGEDTTFIRLNGARVRQPISVEQGDVTLSFIKDKRMVECSFSFGRDLERNTSIGLSILEKCRQECEQLPEDPFCPVFGKEGNSEEIHTGSFPCREEWLDCLLPSLQGTDSAGLLTAGKVMRAVLTSQGQSYWYESDSFCADFSFYTSTQKAVKLFYADKNWSLKAFEEKVSEAKKQLEILNKPIRKLKPGTYRTYFAPEAVADFVTMLSWNGINAASYYQGQSAFKILKEGGANLSPLFNLKEDFSLGIAPRFNSLGELAPISLPIVKEGKLENLLVSMRTAKEYGISSNQAEQSEVLRSPYIQGGSLGQEAILTELGTGLYVSNVHYLNWSDLNKGRITGMTRYACFWVEDGEIIAPIQDLRFDETLYHFWGEGLVDFTDSSYLIPETLTYGHRSVGGMMVPGMLVDRFSYTL